jgi:hypothetical protein
MKKITYKIYREYGALNSPAIFDAVSTGLNHLGFTQVDTNEDLPVIWSVLWQGRMERNREIYLNARSKNKPVLIVEVGNLFRNTTWRVSLNNVNGQGLFADNMELDQNRSNKLGIALKEYQATRKPEILITTQHERGLQWQDMPGIETWLSSTILNIQQYSNRKIIVRPHPRWNRVSQIKSFKNIEIQLPKKVQGTYDNYDIDYCYHCVINHNSGPAIQAAINGVPVICHESSLAYPVSNSFVDIENLKYPDRELWFTKLCHTEWTVNEITQGLPFLRLQIEIEKFFN